MSFNRPTSNKKPGEQSSKTPSGKEVPMAMSMMVDSMVRMIQKANLDQDINESNLSDNDINGN
tara:strand:+ start:5991 stop:6179 length:189 start_codon:yes stop_codon:yes gene_type:complete